MCSIIPIRISVRKRRLIVLNPSTRTTLSARFFAAKAFCIDRRAVRIRIGNCRGLVTSRQSASEGMST